MGVLRIKIFKYNPLGWYHLQHTHVASRRNCSQEFVIILNLKTNKKNPKLDSRQRNVYKNVHRDISNLPSFHTRRVQRKWTICTDKFSHDLRVFLHDVTFAILVFQNIKVAAMLVFQTNSVGVELISHVNVCRYLKRFYTYKKINNSFLKFDHSLLRMPKNNRNWSNLCCRKTRLKNITNPQINRFGPP